MVLIWKQVMFIDLFVNLFQNRQLPLKVHKITIGLRNKEGS
jgi:hypothetical protein